MIEIKNLTVEIEGKKIIDNLSLNIEKGKIYALMGRNGSGKSTLSNVLMGNPKYKISSGKILLNKKDITNISPTERAKLGLFMSFQLPQEIEGITIYDFLRTAYNSLNQKLSVLQFRKLIKEKCDILGLEEDFTQRYINKGFSGGEKKKSEMLQMLVLNPEIIILDEIDSGLDIDSLKTISKTINHFKEKNKTILIISHYKRIFNHINPDGVFIISKGKIAKEGNKELIDEIEEKGYSIIN
jgi:Fe-S cluster assembly ATP-binding protein